MAAGKSPWARLQVLGDGHATLTNAVLAATGFGLLCLTRQFVSENDHFTIGFSGVSGWSVTLYVFAVAVVLTQPLNRWTMRIIVGFAIASYAVAFLAEPFLSSDLYRYAWDGVVQHAGINPYRYVPGDPALTFLREPNQDLFDNINRRDYAPTIYPPVAQMVYWLITWFSPTMPAIKLAMLGCEALIAWVLVKVLQYLGRPAEEVLLLLWCPMWIWEIGGSGHVDAVVIAFVVLALWARLFNRPWLTGLALGCAVMTKFYPLVLFPALYTRRDWKMPTALVSVAVVGYAAYSSVGMKVFGFLSGYSKEEGLDSGSRFFLLDYVHTLPGCANVPNAAFLALAALVLGGLTLWAWLHATPEIVLPAGDVRMPAPNFVRASGGLAFAMMLLFSPHYPWYVLWIVPFYVLAPNLPWTAYVLALFYGCTTYLADPGPKFFRLNEYIYLAVLIAFALQIAGKRWPFWRHVVSRWRTDYRFTREGERRATLSR